LRSTIISLLPISLLLAVAPALAADIRKAGTVTVGDYQSERIAVSGPIRPGDADKLGQMITDDATIVSFSGEGGDYQEALAVANLLNRKWVMTVVEDGQSCLGPCAIAFLGGMADTDDSGDYAAARSIAPTAKLGFAVPGLDVPKTGLTKQAADAAYDRNLKFISDFMRDSDHLFVKPEAVAEAVSPRGGETYFVNDVYRLSHLGVEVQGVRPPQVLTLSMARNLCLLGWRPTEGKPGTRTDEAMANLKWKVEDASFTASTDYFGEGIPVRRTVIPIDFSGDVPEQGYEFCLVDQAKDDTGTLQVACRGFLWGDDLGDVMDRARSFDDPDSGEYGQPDNACDIQSMLEPLSPLEVTAANRWGLVPGDTPLDRIAAVLADYAAREPPL
jgi:hypothetical protein